MTNPVHDFEEWHELVKVFFDTRQVESAKPFRASSQFCQHGDLVVSRVQFTSQFFSHDPSLLPDVDNDYLLFERYFRGTGRGLADGNSASIGPENLHMVDMSRQFITMTSDVITDAFVIPHAAVGYDPTRDPAYFSIPCDSGQGQLLMLAQTAAINAIEASTPDAETLTTAFYSLIRTLLLQKSDVVAPDQAAARGQALIRHYINTNLDDPGLRISKICREFSISRSGLYRLFDDHGGIARYIMDRRLDRCLADLTSAKPERGQVRRIAERWGFYDRANFKRSFRQRFGAVPSECLGAGVICDGDSGIVRHSPVWEWMKKT